ncbi:Aspartate decarboxylase [Parasponia andersonii]|uniref:Aspartate decarboxylase n=1 Tax=Parasponia andersonii TaxID=3476 RepID=A0A2P5BRV8_PARAD|nr:Aspartate decarboxylase [Parasponia andersonii]
MGILVQKKDRNNRLCVDETMSDDDYVVMLPLETMQRLHLSYAHPLWIKGKKGRQTICIAIVIAYDHDDRCNTEPKIRLNRAVMDDFSIRIGGSVSVHCLPDVKKPVHILSTDDNLKLTEFLNNVGDDVLFKIFLRLPNGRSALQYSSVCKRWSSIISNSAFIRNFIHIHDHICLRFSEDYYRSRPFMLLFTRYDRYYRSGEWDDDPHYFEPFCQVFSEKSKVPHGEKRSNYLYFMPCTVVIIASYNDLVLATSLDDTHLKHPPFTAATKNYICNPLTKQWLELPKVKPLHIISGYGFVCEPICSKKLGCTSNVRYRVVIIGRAHSTVNLRDRRMRKLHLGLVDGQLRLSQFYEAEAQKYYVFRVWEMKNNDNNCPSWVLVYNLKLNCSESKMFVLSFHPNHTNVVFLLRGHEVCQYDMFEKKYEKVGEYADRVYMPWIDISTHTIFYPSWPTPLPALPSG